MKVIAGMHVPVIAGRVLPTPGANYYVEFGYIEIYVNAVITKVHRK